MILVSFLWGNFTAFSQCYRKAFSKPKGLFSVQNTLPSRNQCQDRSLILGGGWSSFNAIIDDHSSLKEKCNITVYLYILQFFPSPGSTSNCSKLK